MGPVIDQIFAAVDASSSIFLGDSQKSDDARLGVWHAIHSHNSWVLSGVWDTYDSNIFMKNELAGQIPRCIPENSGA